MRHVVCIELSSCVVEIEGGFSKNLAVLGVIRQALNNNNKLTSPLGSRRGLCRRRWNEKEMGGMMGEQRRRKELGGINVAV